MRLANTSVGMFESLVNTEGIQTVCRINCLWKMFESLVNTEGIQTQQLIYA